MVPDRILKDHNWIVLRILALDILQTEWFKETSCYQVELRPFNNTRDTTEVASSSVTNFNHPPPLFPPERVLLETIYIWFSFDLMCHNKCMLFKKRAIFFRRKKLKKKLKKLDFFSPLSQGPTSFFFFLRSIHRFVSSMCNRAKSNDTSGNESRRMAKILTWRTVARKRFLEEPKTVICLVTEDLIRRYLRECLPPAVSSVIILSAIFFFFYSFPFPIRFRKKLQSR